MDTGDQESYQNNFPSGQKLSSQKSYSAKRVSHKELEISSSQKKFKFNQKAFFALKKQANKGSVEAQFQIG
nr:hypothetical protein [Nitrosopumilus sp.]